MSEHFSPDHWFGWSTILTGFCDLAAELGVDGHTIMSRQGLDQSTVGPTGFPVPTLSLFNVLAELARQADLPEVALRLLRYQSYSVLGALGEIAFGASDLGEALDAFSDKSHTQGTGYVPALERAGDAAIIRFRSMLAPGPLQDLQLDYNIGSTVQTIRALIGPDWSPELVELTRPRPTKAAEWNSFYRCPVRFEAGECMILLAAADLARPLILDGTKFPSTIEADAKVSIDFAQLVDREIIRNLTRGIVDLSAAAQALGITSRTLQRRLERSGTSYQDRLDEIRKVWAQQHLASGQISLTELSQMLGFSDLSTFSARFKRWFGVSPREWRKAHLGIMSQ